MSPATPSILFSPYTLMEEEALGWSLLFSERVIFLHPFPLDLPEPWRPWVDRKLIQILTPPRSAEEIREKDRLLREFHSFAAQNPDFSFLEYLKRSLPGEHLETRNEILDQLRGRISEPVRMGGPPPEKTGEILLCLIHDLLRQEWEISRSLDRLESQEKALAEIMETGFEFSKDWTIPDQSFTATDDPEIYCPPALQAWKKLQDILLSDAPCRITTQQWVWRERYRLDPDAPAVPSIPLPRWPSGSIESFLEDRKSWSESGKIQLLRQLFWELALIPQPNGQKVKDLGIALEAFARPEAGRYTLIFPPVSTVISLAEENPPLLLLNRNNF